MEKLTVGTTYYVPETHKLVNVRSLESPSLAICGLSCVYFSDSKTALGTDTHQVSMMKDWIPIVGDLSILPFLEEDEFGWRVVKDEVINTNDMQAALHSLVTTLKNVPNIQDIYLFGSVAREGAGNDIDIIATVPDKLFSEWTSNVLTAVHSINDTEEKDDSLYFNADLRMSCAADLLGIDPEDFEFYFENVIGVRGYPISFSFVYTDLFLFPHNWKERLEELQNMLPHSDPEFMYKIAKDVKLL